MDDGDSGDFSTILTTSQASSLTITSGISRGLIYRFRYRVANINGWSPYSETGYISAYSVPNAPPQPIFSSATSTSVTLGLEPSSDDNGSKITAYELYIDAGNNLQSSYTIVSSYDGISQTHTLTTATDGLGSAGTIYRVKYRAKNEDNQYSAYSPELIFALGPLPSTPNAPMKDSSTSSNTTIAVYWDDITGDTLSILGYKLYADSGLNDDFSLVYDGTNYPDNLTYTFNNSVNNLLTYRFYVTGVNFNGEGPASSIASL